MNKTGIIIVAGGKGTRMKSSVAKQFMPLSGKPILLHTLERFHSALPESQIVIAMPAADRNIWEEILGKHNCCIPHILAEGGPTRFGSVKNCLPYLKDCELVAVHDAVRPLVSDNLIWRCIETATIHGSAIPAVQPADSFRVVDHDRSAPIDRSILRAVQTPQVFRKDMIMIAYDTPYNELYTDDASVVEEAGYDVTLCDGEKTNIKITTPEDILLAEVFLSQKNAFL